MGCRVSATSNWCPNQPLPITNARAIAKEQGDGVPHVRRTRGREFTGCKRECPWKSGESKIHQAQTDARASCGFGVDDRVADEERRLRRRTARVHQKSQARRIRLALETGVAADDP